MDKNSLGYLRLAMLRNDKLNSLNYTKLTSDNLSWMEINKELIRIEHGMVTSLGNIQSNGRSSLYEDLLHAQKNSEFEIYRLNMERYKGPDELKNLSDATKVKEAADYLELLLQINFPQEFPNPFVKEVLSYMNGENRSSDPVDEQSPYEDTFTQVVMEIAEAKGEIAGNQNSEDIGIEHISTLNDSETQLSEVETSLTDYQPKVISLFEKYKEEHASPENLHGPNNFANDQGLNGELSQ